MKRAILVVGVIAVVVILFLSNVNKDIDGQATASTGTSTPTVSATPIPELTPAVRTNSNSEVLISSSGQDSGNTAMVSVSEESVLTGPSSMTDHEYMKNYRSNLPYNVPESLMVPLDLLDGFEPVASLVMTDTIYPNGYVVVVPPVPADLVPYKWFPHDDPSNPNPVWKVPIASYRDGNNWFCESTTGWCADAVDAFNWIVWTGETVCHPAVGCLMDPDSGAVMVLIINFHDSDEAWDIRNLSGVYVTAGFAGFGRMFDLSGESYNVGMGIGALRNHYLYNLALEPEYTGACGSSALCSTVTYIIVARIWDRPELGINYSHFELLDYGTFRR